MTDLTRLDIAIAEASEFLKLARVLRPGLACYEIEVGWDYPVNEAAKVRAKSLDLSRALVDLRRREEKRL